MQDARGPVARAREALAAGSFDAAIGELDVAWLAAVEHGTPVDTVGLDLEYAEVLLAQGRPNDALVRIEHAWRRAFTDRRLVLAARAARLAAEACVARGRADLAHRCADSAAATARALGDHTEEARAQLVAAEALGLAGSPSAGAARALSAHDTFAGNGQYVLAACAARVAARLLVNDSLRTMRTGGLVVARELLSDACAVFDRRQYVVHSASAHRELAEVLVEIGARTHDVKCIEAALPHFAVAIRAYTEAALDASAASAARREAWTLQLLDRPVDAARVLDTTFAE